MCSIRKNTPREEIMQETTQERKREITSGTIQVLFPNNV